VARLQFEVDDRFLRAEIPAADDLVQWNGEQVAVQGEPDLFKVGRIDFNYDPLSRHRAVHVEPVNGVLVLPHNHPEAFAVAAENGTMAQHAGVVRRQLDQRPGIRPSNLQEHIGRLEVAVQDAVLMGMVDSPSHRGQESSGIRLKALQI
jgi:hypothetical protein